jgi:cold shock CspA family protein
MEGIIDRKVDEKGFGFIKTPDEKSYFFHFSDVENEIDGYNELEEQQTVTFDIVE